LAALKDNTPSSISDIFSAIPLSRYPYTAPVAVQKATKLITIVHKSTLCKIAFGAYE